MPTVFAEFGRFVRDYNVKDEVLTNRNAFVAGLKRQGYYSAHKTVEFRREGKAFERVIVKAHCLDLPKLPFDAGDCFLEAEN
jgi:hypothetical protein